MKRIGIFFGTDTGSTRLIAKRIAKQLDGVADKPLNINRTELQQFLQYELLILGTPTYGEGQLPGKDSNIAAGSWQEFLPQLEGVDLSNKTVALYGLGNQDKYADRFADGLYQLYEAIQACGATIIGSWSSEGYQHQASRAELDGRFVGLVLDQHNQAIMTEQRIADWLQLITPQMLEAVPGAAAAAG